MADEVAVSSAFIYPGGRWLQQAGKGLETFGQAQVSSPYLSTVHLWPQAAPVFPVISNPGRRDSGA